MRSIEWVITIIVMLFNACSFTEKLTLYKIPFHVVIIVFIVNPLAAVVSFTTWIELITDKRKSSEREDFSRLNMQGGSDVYPYKTRDISKPANRKIDDTSDDLF